MKNKWKNNFRTNSWNNICEKSTTYLFAFFVFLSKSWVRDPGVAKPKPTTGFQNRSFHAMDWFGQQTFPTDNSIQETDLSLKTLHFHLVRHVEIVVVWSSLASFHVRGCFFVQLNFIGNLLNEVFGMHFGVGFPGVVPRSLQFLICKEQMVVNVQQTGVRQGRVVRHAGSAQGSGHFQWWFGHLFAEKIWVCCVLTGGVFLVLECQGLFGGFFDGDRGGRSTSAAGSAVVFHCRCRKCDRVKGLSMVSIDAF